VARATELADASDFRLACHLVELAVQAAPDDVGVHRARADIYDRRRQVEGSLMAKGIYGWAARESSAVVDAE
jgi:Tfp pilus assembly protein PilF